MTVVLLIGFILMGCIVYALSPLLGHLRVPSSPRRDTTAVHEESKQRLLQELRELELDYGLDKIDLATYQEWRNTKEAELAALLRER